VAAVCGLLSVICYLLLICIVPSAQPVGKKLAPIKHETFLRNVWWPLGFSTYPKSRWDLTIYFLNALQDQLANLAQLVICNNQWRSYTHAVCCKQEPIGYQPVLYAFVNDGLVDLSG
jgi:hypothetical protein